MTTLLVVGGQTNAIAGRTVRVGATGWPSGYAWPEKDPLDILPSAIDLSVRLAALGLMISGAPVIAASPSLTVTVLSSAMTTILLQIGGGLPGEIASVALLVPLSNGNQIELRISQPITGTPVVVLPPAVAGGMLVLPQTTTLAAVAAAAGLSGAEVLVRTPDGLRTVPAASLAGSGATEFVFTQASPASIWTINHNLARHPEPRVVTTSGDLVDCAASYPSANTVVLTFASAFAGTAYL